MTCKSVNVHASRITVSRMNVLRITIAEPPAVLIVRTSDAKNAMEGQFGPLCFSQTESGEIMSTSAPAM